MRSLSRALGVGCILLGACSKPAPVDFSDADRAVQAKDFPAAVARLEELRKQHGPQSDVLLRLTRVYQAQGEYGKAVACYKEGVAAHPESAELWYAFGSMYLDLAQLERAREAFESARGAGMSDAQLALTLGMCRGRLGDLDGAEKEFERAKAAGVSAALVAYNRAVVLLAQGHAQEGRDLLEETLREKPDLAIARRELARAILADDAKDEAAITRAVALAWEAVGAMPDDWRSHDVLGEAYLAQKDWEAAKAAFVEALRLSQSAGQYVEVVEEHYREAERMLRAAAKAGPKQG